MGLVMTGTDYFVAGGQVHETNILASTEKQKKDSVYSMARAVVKRNTSAEGPRRKSIGGVKARCLQHAATTDHA